MMMGLRWTCVTRAVRGRARDETKTRRRRADDDAREKRLTRARSNRRFDFQARVVVRVVRVAVSQSG